MLSQEALTKPGTAKDLKYPGSAVSGAFDDGFAELRPVESNIWAQSRRLYSMSGVWEAYSKSPFPDPAVRKPAYFREGHDVAVWIGDDPWPYATDGSWDLLRSLWAIADAGTRWEQRHYLYCFGTQGTFGVSMSVISMPISSGKHDGGL